MTDDLGLFNDRRGDGRRQPASSHSRRRPPKRRSGRRTVVWVSVVVVLALIGVGVWYGLTQLLDIGGYDDYAGPGEKDVIVEVADGASTGDIATALQTTGVVASTKAFVKAAESESKVRGIQPGFYQLKTRSSGKEAVAGMLNAKSRKGNLQIRAGSQFDDVTKADKSVEPGIVQKLSTASCADLNGESTCVPADQLRAFIATADLAALGVPDWAVPVASKLEPNRRLEGLIMPGVYDVRPGSTAEQLWQKVVSESSAKMQAIGLPGIVSNSGFTPYQVLIMASLVEREAIEKDFTKVSRVTYNRLSQDKKLEYDSTVNYMLDRPAIRTNSDDRKRPGPYNTYANKGLPPGPISAPSKAAIEAAANPTAGNWLYFVRCQKDGTSCFAETLDQHQANVALAQANDAY